MGSKGRIPPSHLRRPVPGHGMIHPDPFGPGIRPPGAFSPFDMLPHPEVIEQKLAGQQMEMQKLAIENERLAATHSTLRQELASAQHELHVLHAHIGAVKSEREQQMKGLADKISNMEAELKAADPIKSELQKAHSDAQNLHVARQELISKVQQLHQDRQRAQVDVQQFSALISELESVRQEYQHCRSTYDYEKILYNDHLESLQVMEKNYMTMASEVEKLRAELTNSANVDRRTGGPYVGMTGNNENEALGHPMGQKAYEDGYPVPQVHGALPASVGSGANAGAGAPAYVGAQSGPVAARVPSYESSRGPGYDAQRVPGYDAQRGPGYDTQRMLSYDAQRGAVYDAQRGPVYDAQRPGYDMQRGPGYDASRGTSYDAVVRGAAMLHGQVTPPNNAAYGSATPPARVGNGYEAPPRGGNPVQR
ncbi:hypothetical protein CFOL_v3_03585 [Cephalotus follicularis]|uniref:Protein FLX-like 2 n=1 Tax=Cephalotus follicularis TaxID=3775 RepID=A0A1Q3AWM8_CEPFO|nr:hypothetical protein CFOL_v3_03585 [Cephalotus follicularis]